MISRGCGVSVKRMTQKQARFAEAYAGSGSTVYAAREAGLARPQLDGARMLQHPVVAEAIAVKVAAGRERNIAVALDVLHELMQPGIPAAVRLGAAKVVMTDYSRSAEGGGDDRDPAEMSGAELRRRIERLQAEAAERATPLLDLVAQEEPTTSEEALFE